MWKERLKQEWQKTHWMVISLIYETKLNHPYIDFFFTFQRSKTVWPMQLNKIFAGKIFRQRHLEKCHNAENTLMTCAYKK